MRIVLFMLGLGLLVSSFSRAAETALTPTSPPPIETSADEPTDPVEKEYRKLLIMDEEALDQVDQWIQEEQAQREQGVGLTDATLTARILDHLRPVRKAYDRFLEKYPDHAKGHLAYGSFLGEIGEHDEAVRYMEKAKELDPSNPAAWNNLANYYGHRGPIRKCFEYYAKAIELNPKESVYYQNLAVCVFLFRRDSEEFYGITEPEVFEKSLELYRKAMELDPTNFVLATEYAMSFYGMLPLSTASAEEKKEGRMKITARAIPAWEDAMKLAADDLQKQGIYVHLARNKYIAGRYDEARKDLEAITLDDYQGIKNKILSNIEKAEQDAASTSITE
ncbi:MAG: tetratricopeptide repeat protein [Limisphaerales bacterium]|jgi:tetratricopeptide (TPR) repeat protein